MAVNKPIHPISFVVEIVWICCCYNCYSCAYCLIITNYDFKQTPNLPMCPILLSCHSPCAMSLESGHHMLNYSCYDLKPKEKQKKIKNKTGRHFECCPFHNQIDDRENKASRI